MRDELDLNAHFSQLEALRILMDTFFERQTELLKQLETDGDAEAFRGTASELVRAIIRSQKAWDFFRDKLDLRSSAVFKNALWVADAVAWDCYRPAMERAVAAQIVPAAEVREPPLTYLSAEFSPLTWVRGSHPNDGRDFDLGTATLPIPVVSLPWDHVENLWELVSLNHEVAHDIEADLKLRGPLTASLGTVLEKAGVPGPRLGAWAKWVAETFADLVGLQLAGPAFALGLAHLILLPKPEVLQLNPADPHPNHYVRILMSAAYIRTLIPADAGLDGEAAALEAMWTQQYGDGGDLQAYVDDFPHVFSGLMDTPLDALKGSTVRTLLPYTKADDARIRKAAQYLRTGQNAPGPLSIAPRHCVSAARLAARDAVAAGGDVAVTLAAIQTRLEPTVRANVPPGLRGDSGSAPHRQFVAQFADFAFKDDK